MGRRERFPQYQWSAWPDGGLRAAAEHLYMPHITRVEQRLSSEPALVIELEGEYFAQTAQVQAKYAAYGAGESGLERTLRLTWGSRWEEVGGGLSGGGVTLHHDERIFFLETYDEFYAGPFGTFHPSGQGVKSATFYEVVNDPDPWVMEILRENCNTDTFPPHAPTVLEYHRDTDAFSGGGRFAEVPEGHGAVYFWSGEEIPTPEQQAEFEATIARNNAAQAELERSRPRYRHLFIASESVMVELLCIGLPRWEWVDGPPGT